MRGVVAHDEPVSAARGDGPDPVAMAATLQAELMRRSAMLATAESITGGALGSLLTQAPGASDTYLGGVVSYATDVKRGLLDVSEETVEQHGVVSAECAAEMATGVRRALQADFAVSTTGVAGPATQEGKPVGTVFIGVAGPSGVRTKAFRLGGDRAQIRERACLEAVAAVLESVMGAED
jgi:PncC family amidohydrolase